jgi:polyphosphate kinase
MKPEDLIIGNLYIHEEPNEMPYFLKYLESRADGYYRFKVVTSGELMIVHESVFNYLGEIEKTMPAPRKPEQIRIELTNEETIQALNLLGYNLEGYEFGRGHNLSIFTLNLKKGADEKTKATT